MRRLCLLIVVALAVPATARGQDDGLSLRRGIDPISTKLAATIDGFLTSEGAQTSPGGSYRAVLGLDYAWQLMALKQGEEKIGNLIEHRFDLHLMGSYAFTDWAEAALDVPVTLYQKNGFDALQSATGFADRQPKVAGMDDLRLLGKVRLLRQDRHFVTVSAVVELRIPTGDDVSFLGERSVLVYPRAMIERSFFDRLRVGLDAGYRYRALPGRYLNLYVGDELAFALSGRYALPKIFARDWSVAAELLVSTPSRAPFTAGGSKDSLKTPFELLLGLRSQLYKNLYVQLGGGTGFLGQSGFGREGLRVFALFGWERIWHDRDGDGIADEDDKCPDTPGVREERGCPARPKPPGDRDGDGIPDAEDQCPDLPGKKEWHGCPDTDDDGLPDNLDKCPRDPGPAEYDGCPDSDGDEVPDAEDKCPKQAGPATNDGCPLQKPLVVLEQNRLTLKDAVHFDSGKATIKRNSLPILDELASMLLAHPEVKKVRIDGHTDNVGGVAFNQDLSQRRAQSVVEYLVAKGIARDRLQAQGFGLGKPIATNNTALGRAKNRRVECTVLE